MKRIFSFFKRKTQDEQEKSKMLEVYKAFEEKYSAFDVALNVVEPYTTRANHRFTILQSSLNKDVITAKDYNEVIATYTDPADFAPYTEEYLEAHTDAMENLTIAFDSLTSAFDTLDHTDNFYTTASEFYKTYCNIYEFAANAYENAIYCAMRTALEGQLQATKDEIEVMILEAKSSNADAINANTAKSKVAAFKAKVSENAIKAKALEQKAKIAETKVKIFLTKAQSAMGKERQNPTISSCPSRGNTSQTIKELTKNAWEQTKTPEFQDLLKEKITEANKGITHAEFTSGVENGTIGFKVMYGEPIMLVKGARKNIFYILVMLYSVAPIFVIPLWAYHESNWWLLLGIFISWLVTFLTANSRAVVIKGKTVGVSLLMICIVFWVIKGIHNYLTFFSLTAFWGCLLFQIAENAQREYAMQSLIENQDLFDEAINNNKIMILRKN